MSFYNCIYQINSETTESLETDLYQLAKALKVYSDNEKDLLEKLLKELCTAKLSILLIFDNANCEKEF